MPMLHVEGILYIIVSYLYSNRKITQIRVMLDEVLIELTYHSSVYDSYQVYWPQLPSEQDIIYFRTCIFFHLKYRLYKG